MIPKPKMSVQKFVLRSKNPDYIFEDWKAPLEKIH